MFQEYIIICSDIDVPKEKRLLSMVPKGPDEIPRNRQRRIYQIRQPCFGEDAHLKSKQYGIIVTYTGASFV